MEAVDDRGEAQEQFKGDGLVGLAPPERALRARQADDAPIVAVERNEQRRAIESVARDLLEVGQVGGLGIAVMRSRPEDAAVDRDGLDRVGGVEHRVVGVVAIGRIDAGRPVLLERRIPGLPGGAYRRANVALDGSSSSRARYLP